MIDVKCGKCGKELDKPGALLFSPPQSNGRISTVGKVHICLICFQDIIHWINYEENDESENTVSRSSYQCRDG